MHYEYVNVALFTDSTSGHSFAFCPLTLWLWSSDWCVLLFAADELLAEKEKYKSISEELDTTFAELAGF